MLDEEIESTPESADSTVKYMRTLPDLFNDTVGQTLTIENTEPRNVIELLGDFLGITDYKRNLASFWFLDILALQVLRTNEALDNYSRVIFISWLVGEMKLIRDKKFSRDKFFDEMEILFTAMAREVARGEMIPHWDLILFGTVGMEEEMEDEEHDLLTASKDSELKMKSIRIKRPHNDEIESTLPESSNSVNSKDLLDIIIEATYNMYAGEVRYTLVYAVFVEPIEVEVHNIPFTLRKPRPIRLGDLAYIENFDLKLRNALQKMEKSGGRKNVPRKKRAHVPKDPTKEYPPQPPNSLVEENLLLTKRSYLLPLIESKEAASTFDFYEEMT